MAPKNKYTKEEVIDAALQVVRREGIEALTAKSIADELEVSTRPIFTYFDTMDDVRAEVRVAAQRLYEERVSVGLREKIPFFGVGMSYIKFAKDEPRLYGLLFLNDRSCVDGGGTIAAMEHSRELVRPSLERIYGISESEADRYFRDMWLVVHSLATLIVTDGCPYSDDEIGAILTGFSVSLCLAIKRIPGFADNNFDRDAVFRSLVGGA